MEIMTKDTRRILPGLMAAAALALTPALLAKESEAMSLARQLNQAFVEVAETVSPSVVVISISRPATVGGVEMNKDNPFWEFLPPQFRRQFERRQGDADRIPMVTGQGSGVVVREDGYIVTNSHVVEGAKTIKVRFKDGKEYRGTVRGIDDQSDLAVVKIDAENLPTATFADYDKVRVGEFAIAIGAPFDLEYSVTYGHVSAKGRSGILNDPEADQDFIQTDANINPGNSGGPLVDINGKVIGINTLIRGMNTGIGFAIPSNLVREVSDQLIAHGKFTRAWLGVEIRALKDYASFKERVPGTEEGVVVMGILRDGPAAKSDLQLGDVITAVGDHPVTTAQELKNEIRSKPIGKPVELQVVRGKQTTTVSVQPEPWPEDGVQVARNTRSPGREHSADLGLTVQPLTPEVAERYELKDVEGVAVSEVEPGSPAERAGIRHGDVITGVNREPTGSLRAYRTALRGADLTEGIMVNLVREGVSRFVILKESDE